MSTRYKSLIPAPGWRAYESDPNAAALGEEPKELAVIGWAVVIRDHISQGSIHETEVIELIVQYRNGIAVPVSEVSKNPYVTR